jgi:hypothetical protein
MRRSLPVGIADRIQVQTKAEPSPLWVNRVILTAYRSLPVYPRKRTSPDRPAWSGWCQTGLRRHVPVGPKSRRLLVSLPVQGCHFAIRYTASPHSISGKRALSERNEISASWRQLRGQPGWRRIPFRVQPTDAPAFARLIPSARMRYNRSG